MMNNKIIIGAIGLALIGGSFYGGMLYGKNKTSNTQTGARRNFQGMGGNFQGGIRAGGGVAAGNVAGEVLSRTERSFTVKMRDGSSKIVIISSSTPVRMFTEVPQTEVRVGKSVTVNGSTNSDGSVTAQIIQIRDASSTPFGGPGRAQ